MINHDYEKKFKIFMYVLKLRAKYRFLNEKMAKCNVFCFKMVENYIALKSM